MDAIGTVTETCRAKLNLFLDVVGRRPDGYHELVTVFQEIDLADTLTVSHVEGASGIELTVETEGAAAGADVPVDHTNLAVRAARALLDHVGRDARLRMHLVKRIPAGGGLGGGSADAAGALRAVNRLLDLGVSTDDLERLALDIGSDVPFLLRGGAALARGRGELLERLPPPASSSKSMEFLLVVPPFSLSTAAVFGALAGEFGPPRDPQPVLAGLGAGDADALAAAFHNALEPAAERVEPRLIEWRNLVAAAVGKRACLTGSGSVLFVPGVSGVDAAALPSARAILSSTTVLR